LYCEKYMTEVSKFNFLFDIDNHCNNGYLHVQSLSVIL
jgi:hypothetical protein